METTATEVQRYAEHAIKQAGMLGLAGQHGIIAGDMITDCGMTTDNDWLDLLDVVALEVYGLARVTRDSTDIRSVVVVTGIGGPHVEFEVDHNDNVTGRCCWGGDKAEKHDNMPGLFDTLLPLVGGEE